MSDICWKISWVANFFFDRRVANVKRLQTEAATIEYHYADACFYFEKRKKKHYAFPAVAAGREYRGASPPPSRGRPEPSPPSVARSDGRLEVLGPSIPGVLGPPSPLVYKTSRRPLHFERRSERETEQPQSHRPCRSGRRSPSISSPLPLGKALPPLPALASVRRLVSLP